MQTMTQGHISLHHTLASSPELTSSSRVAQLYANKGGPLIGWLEEEAARKGHELKELAGELGLTVSHLRQLKAGLRRTDVIKPALVQACARYLGVPPIVVKLLAGQIRMNDFVCPNQSKEQIIERAFARMAANPQVRQILPMNLTGLPVEAKKAMVLLYAEVSGEDVMGYQQLPDVVRWLQRAVLIHNESEGELARGHRDILA